MSTFSSDIAHAVSRRKGGMGGGWRRARRRAVASQHLPPCEVAPGPRKLYELLPVGFGAFGFGFFACGVGVDGCFGKVTTRSLPRASRRARIRSVRASCSVADGGAAVLPPPDEPALPDAEGVVVEPDAGLPPPVRFLPFLPRATRTRLAAQSAATAADWRTDWRTGASWTPPM
jgi:hypothetical protein